jgi:pimeloyl-ACP methyl ester carboxylesterase
MIRYATMIARPARRTDNAMPSQSGTLTRPGRPDIAWRHVAGAGPTILFCPGYASDMSGSKATALFDHAAATGGACLLFDYAGCGASAGDFADQGLDDWVADAVAVVAARVPAGPLLIVGSSMGGWVMLLLAQALGARVKGLVGIAAAPDFTEWGVTAEEKATILRDGRLLQDNPYGPEPTLMTRIFWQSGEARHMLDAPIPFDGPVRLLHGQADADVPFAISLRIAERIRSAQVVTLLVKDGDHRLSREQDIALLIATVDELRMLIA